MKIHIIIPIILVIISIIIIIAGINDYNYVCPINIPGTCNATCDKSCNNFAEIFYSDRALFKIFIGSDIIFCTFYIIIEYDIKLL